MPLPERQSGETITEFIDRCMADTAMLSEYQDINQRYAVCSQISEKKEKLYKFQIQKYSEDFQDMRLDGMHYVEGIVYAPYHVDTDNETMTFEDVKRLCYSFATKMENIDLYHNYQPCGAVGVQSFIARKDNPEGYPQGAWVLGALVPDEIFEMIKSGELNGWSVGGVAFGVAQEVVVISNKIVTGITELCIANGVIPHYHAYYLETDDDGRVLIGITGEPTNGYDDHVHKITGFSVTEITDGHSHRFMTL